MLGYKDRTWTVQRGLGTTLSLLSNFNVPWKNQQQAAGALCSLPYESLSHLSRVNDVYKVELLLSSSRDVLTLLKGLCVCRLGAVSR